MASVDDMRVRRATPADAGEVLTLQLAAFVSEAQLYRDALIPPLCDDLASVVRAIDDPACTLLVAEAGAGSSRGRAGRLLGSARLVHGAVARIGRLAVAPDAQGTGVGPGCWSPCTRWPATTSASAPSSCSPGRSRRATSPSTPGTGTWSTTS